MVDRDVDHVKSTADRMRELEDDLQRLNEEYALELNLLTAPPSTLHSIGVPSSSMDRQPAGNSERKDSSSSDDDEIRRRVRATPAPAPVETAVPVASTRWSSGVPKDLKDPKVPKDDLRNPATDEPDSSVNWEGPTIWTQSREHVPASEADAGPANLPTRSAALDRVDARLHAKEVFRPGAAEERRPVPSSPPASRSEIPGVSRSEPRSGDEDESSTGGLLPQDEDEDEDDYLSDLRHARARVATRRGAGGERGGGKLPPANAIEPLGSSRFSGPRAGGAPPPQASGRGREEEGVGADGVEDGGGEGGFARRPLRAVRCGCHEREAPARLLTNLRVSRY